MMGLCEPKPVDPEVKGLPRRPCVWFRDYTGTAQNEIYSGWHPDMSLLSTSFSCHHSVVLEILGSSRANMHMWYSTRYSIAYQQTMRLRSVKSKLSRNWQIRHHSWISPWIQKQIVAVVHLQNNIITLALSLRCPSLPGLLSPRVGLDDLWTLN